MNKRPAVSGEYYNESTGVFDVWAVDGTRVKKIGCIVAYLIPEAHNRFLYRIWEHFCREYFNYEEM